MPTNSLGSRRRDYALPMASPPTPSGGASGSPGREARREDGFLRLVVFFSALGGFFKILGGLVYGSRAALVDALTSIVNLIAALLVYRYEGLSALPPDKDHHYGHDRMFIGGSMFSVVLYSVVGGAMTVDLIDSVVASYRVHVYAALFATIGAIPYLTAIMISKGAGGSYGTYAKFTVVELVECVVVVLAAFGGALVSYLIDFTGALILLSYLYVEIARETKAILSIVTDRVPRNLDHIVDSMEEASRRLEVEIRSFRIREVAPGRYHGDVVMAVPAGTSVEDAHKMAHRLEQTLKNLVGEEVDLVIHIEPE